MPIDEAWPGTISSSTGLISGINTGSIIDQLIALDSKPITQLQTRITNNKTIQTAYGDLKTKLAALLADVNPLIKPSTFQSASGTSSNPNVLGLTVKASAVPGSYQFTVARTVTTQSGITAGVGSSGNALGLSGNITVGLGGGKVTSDSALADLNGGKGVSRGTFRITDRAGASATVDISDAITLDDVVGKINGADNVQVKASIGPDGLVLTDTSGGSGTLRVVNAGRTTTAADLGLTGTAAGNTLAGGAINTIGRGTSLSSLNDGLGVRVAGTTTDGLGGVSNRADLTIGLSDGSNVSVSLAGQTTLGGAIDAINRAGGSRVSAAVSDDGKSITLTDATTGSSTLAVSDAAGSHAAEDLGLAGALASTSTPLGGGASSTTLVGNPLRASLGSVLLKDLNGGAGIPGGGQISLTDRAGHSATVVLAGASSLSDVIAGINGAGVGLTASVNAAGTGLQLTDTSGGTGDITVTPTRGPIGGLLGIAGTHSGTSSVSGSSLHRQYLNENSALADLNGGKGISTGKFTITDSGSHSATIDTTGLTSLGDVIAKINNTAGISVTASINATGNGLLLTDHAAGGTGTLTVVDTVGTAAANLNIARSAATAGNGTVDGAYSKTIAVTSSDTLSTIASKLTKAGAGISATILNDGSAAAGYRLSIVASGSGLDGQFTFDAGGTGLDLSTLTDAHNAAVFLGGASSASPVLLTSSSNTVANVVPGVTLNLLGASSAPVTVNITQSSDAAVAALQQFVTDYNDLASKLADDTKFSTDATQKGILLGDATAQSISDSLAQAVNARIGNAGQFSLFSQAGLTVKDDNQLAFDPEAFQAAYAADPVALQRVFTAFNTISTTSTTNHSSGSVTTSSTTTPFGTDAQGVSEGTVAGTSNHYTTSVTLAGYGIGYQLQSAINRLIDPVDGAITRQSGSLDKANDGFNDRIDSLNELLAAKRNRLELQFSNMESILGQLQSQQSALTNFGKSSSSST